MLPAAVILQSWTESRSAMSLERNDSMHTQSWHGSFLVCSSIPTNRHLVSCIAGFVMFTLARERIFLRELRQAYYLWKPNAELLSSRTVLFLRPVDPSIKDSDLEQTFGEGARKCWPVAKLSDLESLVSDRSSAAMSLEEAEVKLIKRVNKRRMNPGKAGFDASVAEKKARPTRRNLKDGGKTVDAITWYREKVVKDAEKIQEMRDSYDSGSATGKAGEKCPAVFVEYATQSQARKAHHHLEFGRPIQLDPRYISLQPKEVLWPNVQQTQAERLSKKTLGTAVVVATIIFWAIPVAVIGTISNVSYLADRVHFLHWINDLPPVVLGLLTGLVPPFLVSWLVSYVPKYFRSKFIDLCSTMIATLIRSRTCTTIRAYNDFCRVVGAGMVFRLSTHPSLPHHNGHQWCCSRRNKNCARSQNRP